MQQQLVDNFGRKHDYMRISITDRCNLRCQYCMGPEGVDWIDHSKILRYGEIIDIVRAAADIGVEKIRITGGEPLVRRDVPVLISKLRQIPKIKEISLTTNGTLLASQAMDLKAAGLQRVNISLDSLDPEIYRMITRGGDLSKALQGLEAALQAGLEPVKVNVVLMKGVNDRDIIDFVRLAFEQPLHVRFIEYMPIGSTELTYKGTFVPLTNVLDILSSLHPQRLTDGLAGNGPADVYTLSGAQGTIGIIRSMSHSFCSGCNRLRLTSDGMLKPCLYWDDELPLKPFLGSPERLQEQFRRAIALKKPQHHMQASETDHNHGFRKMSQIGG